MKYIFIDTNVLVRYFVKTPASQFEESKEVISSIERAEVKGMISILAVDELIWVLENYYRIERANFMPEILKIFGLDGIKIIEEKKQIIIPILRKMVDSKIDFTDYYLLEAAKKNKIYTFDEDLLKLSKLGAEV